MESTEDLGRATRAINRDGSHMVAERGADGWREIQFFPRVWPKLFVKDIEREGRLVVTAIRIETERGLSTEDLRQPRLTVPAIEASLNNYREAKAQRDASRKPKALKVPSRPPYPDSFFEAVAFEYRRAIASGKPPAPTISIKTGRPVPTVHGWVREARRRGFLPSAKGKGMAG